MLINYYICPSCGRYNYYYVLAPYQRPNLISPNELTQLQGKRIRTTVPNLGSVTATVGKYDANTNRVQLQNIVSEQDGVNHGTLNYLPSDLGGYQVLDGQGTGSGPGSGGSGGIFTEEQLNKLTTLTKTIGSFDYPSPTIGNPFRMKRFRVYLEVQVPQVIAQSVQSSLDSCMEIAKARAVTILAPFITPATIGGLAGAIPGAVSAAFQAFSTCVASNPTIYPYINRIKINIRTSDKVV